MENIWEILKIEQTKERTAIKRAYAALAKEYNPEEQPEEFLRIREAYEKAMAYARESAAGGDGSADTALRRESPVSMSGSETEKERQEEERFHFDFTQDDPFAGHPAVLKFKELYTGKRRRDRTVWADYFTSDDFLTVWREEGFTAALLSIVKELSEAYPLCREFLTDLYIVYGLGSRGQQLVLENNAAFYGIEHIADIALMGPSVRFKGNDPALSAGFRDYRELIAMASPDRNWDSDAFLRLGKIIDGYMLSHISDRPIQYSAQYELYQRHPKSLRLLAYFFYHTELPAQAYSLLWNHLYLENATNGKEKLLYGRLREIVLERAAEAVTRPKLDYRQLIHDYTQYCVSGRSEEREWEEAYAFLSREDIKCAMMDETFVDRQILPYWITKNSARSFVELLEKFYTEHMDAPFREKILKNAAAWKSWKQVETEFAKDEASAPAFGVISMEHRPFARYYLNTAFHLACAAQSSTLLSEYLESRFPYSVKWGREFVSAEGGGFTPEHPIELMFGEHALHIIFHVRYIEYHWDEQPFAPWIPWESISSIPDDTLFWLVFPLIRAPFGAYENICGELKNRLSRLPLHEEDTPVIADCLAGNACVFEEEADSRPICTFYEETDEKLYGCDIFNNGALSLYEETPHGKIPASNSEYYAPDMDRAVRMAKRLLTELTSSCPVTASVSEMPEKILVRSRFGIPRALEGGQATAEALKELMEQYFAGKIRRLELAWGFGSLVFSEQDGYYACIFFDKWKMDWYALVGMPELYETAEADTVRHVPFGLGTLPEYMIHQSTAYMKSKLNEIFSQITGGIPNPRPMMWAPQIYRFETKLRYHLAKRLYGGYPADEAENQLADRFYIPLLPTGMSYTDLDGKESGKIIVGRDKKGVQDILNLCMSGGLSRLVLTWDFEGGRGQETGEEEEPDMYRRHIAFMQEQGRYLLACLDTAEEKTAYLVADVQAYMKAEGRKYEKTSFCGRTVPAYLVHEDMRRIRDCLDILIPQIAAPYAILHQFGEFSPADILKTEEF